MDMFKRIRWIAAHAWLGIDESEYRSFEGWPVEHVKNSYLEAGDGYLTIIAACNKAIGDREPRILTRDELKEIVGEIP